MLKPGKGNGNAYPFKELHLWSISYICFTLKALCMLTQMLKLPGHHIKHFFLQTKQLGTDRHAKSFEHGQSKWRN